MMLGWRASRWLAVFGGALLLAPAGAAAGEAPIKLGLFGPLKEAAGVDILEAAKLAVEEINAAGGRPGPEPGGHFPG